MPVLLKDFVFDEYQVWEARAAGADAVLLIVSILDAPLYRDLFGLCQSAGMDVLVEVFDESELEVALSANPGIVGVNNRNLRTLETSLDVFERVAPGIGNDRIRIAESGMKNAADVRRMGRAGADAVLVGESLMRAGGDAASLVRTMSQGRRHMSNRVPMVKICGLRDADTALATAKSGADFIGLNFVEGVRRQLKVMEGAAVVSGYRLRAGRKKYRMKIVGLFRNQPAAWVNEVSKRVVLDYVQLCGDEDETYMRSMWRPVLKQVRVRQGMSVAALGAEVQSHLDAGRMVVLDRYDEKTPGGSGKTFDWSVAEGIADRDGVLLAGGLSPDNVASAIRMLRPWGVDVSSGVETDGVKDRRKIQDFIETAKAADPAV